MGSAISRQSKVSHKTMYQDIKEVRVEKIRGSSNEQNYSIEGLEAKPGGFVSLDMEKDNHGDNINDLCYYDYDEEETKKGRNIPPGPNATVFGWGHWFTFGELEKATRGFSMDNIVGEGGYGIVYKGTLPNGNAIAVKRLLDNMGQAEQEFNVEVDIIGRIRHRNLVRLLGVCTEGAHRMLVYEYVDNGNLEQWLHGPLGKTSTHPFTWDARMKIILGTAKAIAYLHEDLDPKIVHRDIKASNILVDIDWNAKVSDFGLAKLLGSQESHISTRVMGTFGYVAPEYANTGLLNERSDVYSFGVLLLETITGREPVDYSRPIGEVNLVDWLKVMVGSRRSEEVVDPTLTNADTRPTSRTLKRSLLVALHCVDPDSDKRPRMGQVVRMLEAADNFPFRNNDYEASRDLKRGLASSPSNPLQSCKENSNPMGYSPKKKDSLRKG